MKQGGTAPADDSSLPQIDHEYESYPISVAYNIYQSDSENPHCKNIGNGSFFDAKRIWERLIWDLPIKKAAERRLLPIVFQRDARRV